MEDFLLINRLSEEVEYFSLFFLLSIIPVLLITMTTFVRNVIVFSVLRHALGLQQSPPNLVIIILSLMITLFTMQSVFEKSYDSGIAPYLKDELAIEEAIPESWAPFRTFMLAQVNERDLHLMYEVGQRDYPEDIEQVTWKELIPAFVLSELARAFKMAFLIYLPFLLIDLVVAAVLTSLGMIMVPPITISLPIKLMLFVVIHGWSLIFEVLIASTQG